MGNSEPPRSTKGGSKQNPARLSHLTRQIDRNAMGSDELHHDVNASTGDLTRLIQTYGASAVAEALPMAARSSGWSDGSKVPAKKPAQSKEEPYHPTSSQRFSMNASLKRTRQSFLRDTTEWKVYIFYAAKNVRFVNSLNFFTTFAWIWFMIVAICSIIQLTGVASLNSDNRSTVTYTGIIISSFLLLLTWISLFSYYNRYTRVSHRHLLGVTLPVLNASLFIGIGFLIMYILNHRYSLDVDGPEDYFDDDDKWSDKKLVGKAGETATSLLFIAGFVFTSCLMVVSWALHAHPEGSMEYVNFKDEVKKGYGVPDPLGNDSDSDSDDERKESYTRQRKRRKVAADGESLASVSEV